jgi:hypothetical protein
MLTTIDVQQLVAFDVHVTTAQPQGHRRRQGRR